MWLFINTLQVKGQCIGQTRQEENAGVEMLTKNILHSSLNAAIVNCTVSQAVNPAMTHTENKK